MHLCPKRQLEVSIRSEKEVRKTGNLNRKYKFQKTKKKPVILIQILDTNQVDTTKIQRASSSDHYKLTFSADSLPCF